MQNLTWNDVKRKLKTVRSIFLPEAVLTFCYQVEVPLITVCFCLSKWRHPFQWVSQSITWMFQGWSFREAFGQQFQKPGLPFSINLIWIRINYRFISTRRDIFLESMIKTDCQCKISTTTCLCVLTISQGILKSWVPYVNHFDILTKTSILHSLRVKDFSQPRKRWVCHSQWE